MDPSTTTGQWSLGYLHNEPQGFLALTRFGVGLVERRGSGHDCIGYFRGMTKHRVGLRNPRPIETRSLSRVLLPKIVRNQQFRHLDRDQLKEIAIDLRRRGTYWTLEKVGETLGVHASTVMRWIPDPVIANAITDEPSRVIGADGKSYPTHKPRAKKSAVATNERQEKQAHAAMGALVDSDAREDEQVDQDTGGGGELHPNSASSHSDDRANTDKTNYPQTAPMLTPGAITI